MVSKIRTIALAGALAFGAAPAFAQDAGGLNLNPLGLPLIPNNLGQLPLVGNGAGGLQLPLVSGNGLDLDPLHIFSPAPAAAAAPAPAKAAVVHHHHYIHHHYYMHHHVWHKMPGANALH